MHDVSCVVILLGGGARSLDYSSIRPWKTMLAYVWFYVVGQGLLIVYTV